jgi:LPS sulfotransferase NodH
MVTGEPQATTDVRRFMILSSARTGSNLLLSLLSAHPRVKTYGELFNFGALRQDDLLQALDDPIAYLQQRVYKAHRAEVSAVGFKMFYEHLTEDYFRKLVETDDASEELRRQFTRLAEFISANYDWPTLERRFQAAWQFLIDDQSLSVVHLTRHNMLDSLISLKTAFATRQWWTLHDNDQPAPPVHLEPDECRRYFQKLDGFVADADRAFAAHRKLDVSYEQLVDHRQGALDEIFAFLNVPYQDVATRMKKQRRVAASESVVNYGQLKDLFRETKWHAFFA